MMRVATDVGGTFTDLAGYDESTNALVIAKASTTPDIASGVADSIDKARVDVSKTDYFIHGSTVAINTVIERKGVRTGLLTTRGFRDVLEIARGNIINSFDLMFATAEPLVRRRHRLEIDERMLADGSVERTLDEESVRNALRKLMDDGMEAVAVCLLHAYANPAHEHAVKDIISRQCGNSVFASISSDLLREYREFERTSTAVLNAYVGPRVSAYLARLESYLSDGDFRGNAMVMQSNGGTMTFGLAKAQPVRTMESGPVGGTVAAANVAVSCGFKNVVAFDMGGTTAKVSIVRDGNLDIAEGYWIGGEEMGYPLQLPVVDVVEIGAGGGSIARIDALGGLKVGPTSAGAVPGPACYDRGGGAPTVTDADLMLGRLNADYFLGGELKLSRRNAEEAISRTIAQPLGLEPMRAAFGIVKIADTNMAHAVRLMTVEKGHDPRDFVLVAYGGAGPSHAVAVAREISIGTVVVPNNPGILSAIGMLLTDAKEEFVLSRVGKLADMSQDALEDVFAGIERSGIQRMRDAGFGDDKIATRRSVDMRYTGQEFTLRVDVPPNVTGGDFKVDLSKRFTDLHEHRYGHAFDKAVPEIVSLRVEVVGKLPKPQIRMTNGRAAKAEDAMTERQVYFEGAGLVRCKVYRRERLMPGARFEGPAVIEEMASTTLIHPGDSVAVDADGNLVIKVAPKAAARSLN